MQVVAETDDAGTAMAIWRDPNGKVHIGQRDHHKEGFWPPRRIDRIRHWVIENGEFREVHPPQIKSTPYRIKFEWFSVGWDLPNGDFDLKDSDMPMWNVPIANPPGDLNDVIPTQPANTNVAILRTGA